ncbi:hypothetical protein [Actinoallomurus acaciae]|uniref:Uncharacterized protein n=1 Tax=Actinoallomurus acaciae TaxID=502577 RepID=A0ABV5YHE0_9ACTN
MTAETREQVAPADGEADPRLSGLRVLGRAIGSIVAPTTLLTTLLYYFGWSFSYTFYGDFGVSYTVVGLGTTDYLITSVDGLFEPTAILGAAVLLGLWGHSAFGARLHMIRCLIPGVAAAGALPTSPNVTLYSEKSLNLHVPGVRETRCGTPQTAFAYRYDGLKLLRRSGDQYLFLPQGWTRQNGLAVLISRNDSTRLEFSLATGRTTPVPAC